MFVGHFVGFQFTKRLKHLIVHVTNHCNLRCKHCFIDFSPKRDLPLSTYQKLGQDLGKVFWVDIGGGDGRNAGIGPGFPMSGRRRRVRYVGNSGGH